MPVDLFQALAAIEGEDGQLKTAAKKLGHEPEMGQMDAGGTASGLGQSVGRGPMDAKALLDEKALEAAGSELEGRTFQDPRERSGARNIGNRPGPGPTSPTDASRVATKPSNVHLPKTGPAVHRPDSLVRKAAGLRDAAGKALGALKNKGKAISETYEDARSTAMYGRAGKGKAMAHLRGAAAVAKKHPKTVGGAVAGVAAAGYGASKLRKLRASEKRSSLSLAQFVELQGNEAGIKMASQAYGDREVLQRTIQLREAQSVGMKLACGMFKAAAAANAQ